MVEISLPDEAATIEFGKRLARELRVGSVLSLEGDLGAGKTTLVKGIALGLGGRVEDISSPTFSIVHEHKFPRADLVHCDFYRLDPEKELADLGGLEFFFQEKIFVVEWLEKSGIQDLIFKKQIVRVMFETEGKTRSAQCEITLLNS
jgi:tRNA threonylcarbamoyladenosine biosynthesis protein TsaE